MRVSFEGEVEAASGRKDKRMQTRTDNADVMVWVLVAGQPPSGRAGVPLPVALMHVRSTVWCGARDTGWLKVEDSVDHC